LECGEEVGCKIDFRNFKQKPDPACVGSGFFMPVKIRVLMLASMNNFFGMMEWWKNGIMGNIKHGGTEDTEKHREEGMGERENGMVEKWKNGMKEIFTT
jgi:hypothetical protein